MQFNIQPKGPKTWYLDVRVKRGGAEKRKREVYTGTRSEAKARFLEIRKQLLESTAAPGKQVKKFGDLVKIYLEKKWFLTPKYLNTMRTLDRELGLVSLDGFTEAFEKHLANMLEKPSVRTKKLVGSASINRKISMTAAVFNLAYELGYVDSSPITPARYPRASEIARDRVLSDMEIDRLLNVTYIEAPHLYPITKYALNVPCRKAELVGMRVSDLDLKQGAIRVRNGRTKNKAGLWKPIPPDMLKYFSNIPLECEWIFYRHHKGRFLQLGDFKRAWNRCLRLADIPDFRFHDTRHIAATRLLDNGTPNEVVNTIAGWKTDMLRTYYNRSGKRALKLVKFQEDENEIQKVDTKSGLPL